MFIYKLFRRLQNDDPGVTGGTIETPEAPTPEAPEVPDTTPDLTPPEAAEPAEPFAGLSDLLDGVGAEPAAKVETPAPEAPAPAVPAPVVKPAEPPAPPGQMDLTPPEGMNERSKARWAELTERVKVVPDLERRATEATQQLDSVRRMVSESGLQPDEFSNVLTLGRLYKSNNPQDLQGALTQIEALRADIATRLGTEVAGVDLLSQHPDLKQRVEGMSLSREDALEMVRLRTQNQQAERTTQQSREMQVFQQTVQSAAQQMDATLDQRKHLPGHEAKVNFIRSQLGDQAKLQAFVSTYEPHQWQAAVLMMYDAYTPPAAPAPPPAPQPLRPGHTASGRPAMTQPKNALDAVNSAFAAAGL